MSIKRRVGNRSGFTLPETMLAVLILLLVSSIVVTGIPVAKNVYEKVVLGANAQILLSTTVNALRDELGTARDIQALTAENGVTYFSADTGAKAKIYMGKDSKDKDAVMIQEYATVAGFNEDSPSIGTARTLLPEAAATSDLYVKYDSVTVADGVVTFNNLAVYRGATQVTRLTESGSNFAIRSISVVTSTT